MAASRKQSAPACWRSPTRRAAPPTAFRSSSCTGFPTIPAPMTTWCRRSSRPAAGRSCPTCAASARRASCVPTPRAPASRRRWATISRSSWTRSASSAPCSPATIGAAAPPAWSRRCGRTARAAWSRPTATTSTTSPHLPSRLRRSRSSGSGINTISTPSAAAPDLAANRRAFCKFIWRTWSPTWTFDDATYDRSAASFDNPDFVDVVIHSYRCRYGYAPGDPSLETIEQRLAAQPRISVPTIVLHGGASTLSAPESSVKHAPFFTGPYQHRIIPDVGHNLPQEAPGAFAEAVLELVRATR